MRREKVQEEMEEKPRKRKKKKGFGYYLYAVVILILTLANITLATLLLTHVQKIEVTGTQYSDKESILEWFQEDQLTKNSLYAFWKMKTGSYTMPEYLESVECQLRAPWEIRLKVKEKQIMAGIKSDNSYSYIDKEGFVLVKSSEMMEGVPIVEGVPVKKVQQFKTLEVKDKKIFSYIDSVVEEIEENQLSPDRIIWENDSMNLYFEEICVSLGKSDFDEKLVQLASILDLAQLKGKSGTLHLEHYNKMSTSISFEENTTSNAE